MSVFVVADPGADHRGSLSRMLRLFDAAKAAGADAVKPQLYRAESLYAESCPDERAISKANEMPLEWLAPMKEYADGIGIEFMCSAFSKELYDAVDPFVRRHKIASLEANDDELIAHVVSKGKPILISTGACDANRINELCTWGQTALGHDYARVVPTTLLHCVTAYPAPIEDANMNLLVQDFQYDGAGRDCDGLSDHSAHPTLLPIMAVALGAEVIEKHIRLEDSTPDNPDYAHSLTPSQFREMVQMIRMAEAAMGDGQKRVMPSEEAFVALKRKSGKLRGAA